MLQVVLIDDEPKALKGLEWELNKNCPEVRVLAKFLNPKDAILFLKENKVDGVFLDIEMPEMDGFKFLDHFNPRPFPVIFTTAYSHYAIKAIRKNAFDYILKPINTQDLVNTIAKLDRQKSLDSHAMLVDVNDRNRKISIPVEGKLIFLACDEILYCESDGNYCKIFLTNNQSIFVSKKLKDIENLLPERMFFRIHNQYVVNLTKVREFLSGDSYVVIKGDRKIPVARSRKTEFLERM